MNTKIVTGIVIAILVFTVFILGGILWRNNQNQKLNALPKEQPSTVQEEKNNAQIANPASVYCKEQGGELKIQTGSGGGQVGICVFSNGKECEEWAYYRKECTADVEKDWKSYNNEQYGFGLTLPETWKEYTASAGHYDNWDTICFSFKSGHQPLCIFQIVVYTKDQWEKAKKNIPSNAVIKENGQYVFNFEYGSECMQFDKFQCDREKEVPDIVKSFKLEK